MPSTSADLYSCAASGGNRIVFDHDTFDGSDAPHWGKDNANCSQTSSAGCATGSGIYLKAYIIRYSIFRMLHWHAVTNDTISAHDNLWEYEEIPPTGAMVGAQHPDALMVYSGTAVSFYNNVVRHNYASEMFYFNVNSGASLYIFNNVFYDNSRYDTIGDTSGFNCINLAAQTKGGNETLYVYNNTFDNDTDDSTGGGCQISIYGTTNGNSMGYPWTGNVYTANNHLIGYSSINSLFIARTSGATFTVVPEGGDIVQPTATARSQGYVQSTTPVGDVATSASGATVGTGTNFTSDCSTFSSDSYLCSGTSGAAGGTSGALVYPQVTPSPRPSSGSWDVGALQFSTASEVSPPTNLSAVVQ